jgi:hypothetical protein
VVDKNELCRRCAASPLWRAIVRAASSCTSPRVS